MLTKNIKDILKLKENFPKLLTQKIKNIYKTIYDSDKLKPKINMTTTEPSCKHIIISINNENIKKFITSPSKHIANLNQALKGIKTDIFIDFIYNNHQSIIVIANKVASPSDLSVVENYIKNIHTIDTNNIQSTCLLQSKLYLKILGILYIFKGTNTPIDTKVMETIIKSTYIFNNTHIASRL